MVHITLRLEITHISQTIISFFLVLLLVMPSHLCDGAASEENSWGVVTTITEVTNVRAVHSDSLRESLFILNGGYIEEWGILNVSRFHMIFPITNNFRMMDWNDKFQWFAWVRDSDELVDPPIWNSEFTIFDYNGNPLFAFEPYGNLPFVDNSSIIDIEWRPDSSDIAIAYQDNKIIIYNILLNDVVFEKQFDRKIIDIEWNPNGSMLGVLIGVLNQGTQTIFLINLNSKQELETALIQNDIIEFHWYYNGDMIFLTRQSSGIIAYDFSKKIFDVILETKTISVTPSPNEPLIIIIEPLRITFFNPELNTTEIQPISYPQTNTTGWTQDGTYFYSMDERDVVKIWGKKSVMPPPTVGIISPIENATVSGYLNITGWAHGVDDDNIIVFLKIGGWDWISTNGDSDWYYELNTTKINNGILVIQVRAFDKYAASDVYSRWIFILNNETYTNLPPIISIDSPSNGSIEWGIIQIIGRAKDDHSIDRVQIRVGTGLWETILINERDSDINWSYLVEIYNFIGDLTIRARAFDGVLFSRESEINIKIAPQEIQEYKLTIKVLYPPDNANVSLPFRIQGIVEGDSPDIVFIGIADDNLQIAQGTSIWQLNIENANDGWLTVRVVAIKNDYYSDWVVVHYYIDQHMENVNYPPLINITSPLKGQAISEDFYITGWSFDDTLVKKVEIKINNGSWQIVNGTINWSYLVETKELPPGWYNIYVRAYDGKLFSDNDTSSYYIITPSPRVNENNYEKYILLALLAIAIVIFLIMIKKKSDYQ